MRLRIEVGVIKQAMNDITKTDVAMNNILLRARHDLYIVRKGFFMHDVLKPRTPSKPCRNIKGSQPQRADTVKAAKPKASPKVKAKAKDKVPRVRKGSKAKSKARKTHPKTEAEGDDESWFYFMAREILKLSGSWNRSMGVQSICVVLTQVQPVTKHGETSMVQKMDLCANACVVGLNLQLPQNNCEIILG